MSENQGSTNTDGQKSAPRNTNRFRLRRELLIRGGPLIGLLLLYVILIIATPHFFTPSNQVNILRRTSILALLAIGQTFVILTAGIDLSVAAVSALAASVASVAMTQPINILGVTIGPIDFWLGLPLALLVGMAAGALNGFIITKGRIPDFIMTLGTLEVYRGVALLVTGGLPVPSYFTSSETRGELPAEMVWLGSGDLFGLPVPGLIAILVLIISAIILRYTALGRAIFAVGGNREAARVSGINIDRTKIIAYTISGLFAAIAGFLLAGRLNSANALMAEGQELSAIASVVIGGTNLFGGEGGVIGSFIGALIIGVLGNGLNLLNVSDFWQRVIQGAIIISVVILDQLRRRRLLK